MELWLVLLVPLALPALVVVASALVLRRKKAPSLGLLAALALLLAVSVFFTTFVPLVLTSAHGGSPPEARYVFVAAWLVLFVVPVALAAWFRRRRIFSSHPGPSRVDPNEGPRGQGGSHG